MGSPIDGKAVAARVREEVAARAARLTERGVKPGLAVVLVGDDAASQTYVRFKERACEKVGIASWTHRLPSTTDLPAILEVIDGLNRDSAVHGILVQLPLPRGLNSDAVLDAIDPGKDVDGFHPMNMGRLAAGLDAIAPCTPKGIMRLLEEYDVPVSGKDAVVIGRSRIVGRPMASLLTSGSATVTVCHSRTRDLQEQCRRADILVAAVGRPGMVTGDWIKPGAVVIDVGINRLPDGRLVGDVDTDSAMEVAALVTPVPGGVGPMTVAMLLSTTCTLAEATVTG
ncbi:MAG: bifunctional methylenetetrahydrofolate dehydrogenase/methenyltetrahydrofolate cyclohydrolase FolD [Myxococcota bacterium]|nr:bifunctional methylenetetrahydrofolate dehydrogenase/methenyltetrahydrofolate cyclohydrolase FolD [Myxococcota bacterium]